MKKLVSAAEIAAIDKESIDSYGLPGELLMGWAGKAVFEEIQKFLPATVVILAGKGNNGGDGLVLAHFLHNAELPFHLCLLWPPESFSPTAAFYWNILQRQQVSSQQLYSADDFARLLQTMTGPVILVDAVFGTGLSSPLSGLAAELAQIWNQQNNPYVTRIAIDIPSGINGSGTLGKEKLWFQAEFTYTMGLPKVGLYTLPGRMACGQIHALNIGFPRHLLQSASLQGHILEEKDFFSGSAFLPPLLPPDSHKYQRGVAHIIAGSPSMEGAAMLTAQAAQAGGAGLVHLYTREESASHLAGKNNFLQIHAVKPHQWKSTLSALLDKSPRHRQSFIIGPGLGRDPLSIQILSDFVEIFIKQEINAPIILDADACYCLPRLLEPKHYAHFFQKGRFILATPHHGELQAMFPSPLSESTSSMLTLANLENDKVSTVTQLSRSSGLHLLVKGADTVIASPSGAFFVNPTGNPLLAKGGSGDILSGLIGGMAATGMDPFIAAASSAYLAGWSADTLLQREGNYRGGPEQLLWELQKILARCGLTT